MQLLSKQEVNTQKARAQKREYDEGMKLARRVDGLREVVAAEEASLEKFRRESVAKIHEEITHLTKEKGTLEKEVSDLKREREDLKKPLTEEWEDLNIAQEAYERSHKFLLDSIESAKATERDLDERAKGIRADEQRIEEQKRLHNELLASAYNDRASTRAALEDAERTFDNARVEEERIVRELNHREAGIEATEARQKKRDEEQDERERLLNSRETRVVDREATITRQLQRYGTEHRNNRGV